MEVTALKLHSSQALTCSRTNKGVIVGHRRNQGTRLDASGNGSLGFLTSVVRWRKKHSNYTDIDVAGADITIHSPAFTEVTALLKHVTEFSQSRLNWDTRMNATTFKPATVQEKTLSDPTKSCCVATVQGQRTDSRS